jgi:YVTN family beta-propeller protein
MKKINKITAFSLVMLVSIIMISVACKKNETPLNINYPAAYVVNGEDASISVINLSKNEVTETIELMGTGSDMIMWPHHIYNHENHLAIGVPGMDLSAGHTGGMMGMMGRVLIVDAVKGLILKDIETPMMNHNAIYSPDGTEIWTSQMDAAGTVLVYDANTYSLKNTITVGEDPAEVTFSADGSKAYVCNGGSNTVTVINPITKSVITTLAVGLDPVGAWTSSIGKMFIDNEAGNSISIIDVATNAVVGTVTLGFMPGYAAYHTATGELWVTDPDNGKVAYFLDMGSNNWMKHGEFTTGAGAHAIAFNANTAYVTNQMANTVSVINVTSHTVSKTINVGKKPNGIVIKL